MSDKVSLVLRKDLLGKLSEEREKAFIFGCLLYEEYTNEGTAPISKEQAAALTDNAIRLLIRAIFLSDVDFEKDEVASITVDRIAQEAFNRHPPEMDVEKSLLEFKERHKEFFNE